ncbi:type VI secretion system baseplate subunit TssE [Jeongeupia sp. USM3]|uniref:type VI secretion system baseplate subunit TssE n=1 Tax=Jeongeupia sp. USM3 TaxID=1906741 RepID=UPI00089E0257|nr:type VI secretion system baseplate subunit TssE [Jeongeupia sp. USM3]AOY01842.1 hypothetical protein BJP62_16150 [Jeongeupia sp. USM3]
MTSAKPFLAPLFDRLADDTPDGMADDAAHWRHDVDDVIRSVQDELSRLLNSRRGTLQHAHPLSVIDYGVEDWSAFALTSPQQQHRVERQIAEVIRHFEPRVSEPQVRLVPLPGQSQRLGVQISGRLAGHPSLPPVVFINTALDALPA